MQSSDLQQNFYENLGNRDYDCFYESDEIYLKLKIGYTLYGPPTQVDLQNNISIDFTAEQYYDKEQNVKINETLAAIKSCSKFKLINISMYMNNTKLIRKMFR